MVDPLDIMLPKHIATCIRFAATLGWSERGTKTVWLGFQLRPNEPVFCEIPPNSHSYYDRDSSEWTLPTIDQHK